MADINETLGQTVSSDIESKEDEVSKNGGIGVNLESFTTSANEVQTGTRKVEGEEQTQLQNPENQNPNVVQNTETEITNETVEKFDKAVSDVEFLVSNDINIDIIQGVLPTTPLEGEVPNVDIQNDNAKQPTENIVVETVPLVEPVVDAVNDATVVVADTATTNEDASVTIDVLANDTDIDGNTATLTSVENGTNGSTAIVDGQVVYTPNADFNGTDTFTYTNSEGNSETVTVKVDAVQAERDSDSISTGDGADTVTLTGVSDSDTTYIEGTAAADTITENITMDNSTIDTGAAADTVTINPGAGTSNIATNVNLDTGSGADTVTVNYTLDDSTFNTGDDADTVTLTGVQNGSIVNTGDDDGSDTVTIGSVSDSSVDTGGGADTLTIVDVDGSTIDAKDGINTVTLTSVEGSTIITGADADTVTINGFMDNSSLDTGTGIGIDTVTIADAKGDSTISTGAGADVVTIGIVSDTTSVDVGEGIDTVTLSLVKDGFNGSVNLGTDVDTFTINLEAGATLGADTIFNGGEGLDTLTLTGVTLDEWNNGVSDHFVNFETVTVNGTAIDAADLNFTEPDTTAETPTLIMSIVEAIVPETVVSTYENSNSDSVQGSGNTAEYDLGGTTNSVDVTFKKLKANDGEEAKVELLDKNGDVVDTVVVAGNNGNGQETHTITSEHAFNSIKISGNSNSDSFDVKNVSAKVESSGDYEYHITLNAGLTDTDSESLSDITVSNLPDDVTLSDANGDNIVANSDGSYTVGIDADGNATVTIESETAIASDTLNSITSSVSSTESNGGDESTIIVNDEGNIGSIDDNTFTVDFDNIELDFDNISATNVDTLDLGIGDDTNINVTNLDINDILKMTDDNELTIFGDEGDTVSLEADTWTKGNVENGFTTFTAGGGDTGLQEIQLIIDSHVDVQNG